MTENIVKKTLMLELPVPLTEAEVLEIARRKANLELELEQIKAQSADAQRGWSARVKEQEKRISQLGAMIRTGEHRKIVDCFERYVADGDHAGKVEVVRKDNGEVFERRMANLLEARGANVEVTEEQRDAAKTQRDAGVEEDDDGNVIAPAGDGAKSKKGRRGKPH